MMMERNTFCSDLTRPPKGIADLADRRALVWSRRHDAARDSLHRVVGFRVARRTRRQLWAIAPVCAILLFPVFLFAQGAAEGQHAEHHPAAPQASGLAKGDTEAGSTEKESGKRDGTGAASTGMMGTGKGGGGMGGGKGGGGMGGMMEKMGAPKPKETYPTLMSLPDLPLARRGKIEQQAQQRMVDGKTLLADGMKELATAQANDDFATLQAATAKMREGLARFESGLAARRALVEGKSPSNVALTWFKREMNLLPPTAAPGFRFFGMTTFHTSVMAVLVAFGGAMVWMYFGNMRRAMALMEKLATTPSLGTPSPSIPSSGTVEPASSGSNEREALTLAATSRADSQESLAPSPNAAHGTSDCCDESAVQCADADDATGRADISSGLLRVAKRQLCRLRVAKIYQETPDVKTFRLVACHGGPLPFNYLPGQFLTLTLPIDEKKSIRRSYTISSSPTQGYCCEITVKREEQGAGSRHLHDHVQEGAMLKVQAPSGKFVFTGSEADAVVLIAGGVGITPMMSITRALTDMGWPGDIDFIVACRDPEHFIFASELEQLAERHSNVHLHVAMSRIKPENTRYHAGRLTKDLIAKLVPDIASKWVQLCGAPQMMDSTKAMLAELGVPADNVHLENFGSQQKPHVKAAEKKKVADTAATEVLATVKFATSGQATRFQPDETVLEAAERVEVSIDNSCRIGMCGVCAVKLLSGQVTMEVDDGLDPDDKDAGMILACQAKAKRDVTVEA